MVGTQALEPFFDMIDVSTCDSAGSNLRVERYLSQKYPSIPRLTLRCEIHIASGVQLRAFKTVDHDMSGIINLALALQPAGAAAAFRGCLRHVIKNSIVVYDAASPPLPDSPGVKHRTRIFDLLLGKSPEERRRSIILHSLLKGPISGDTVEYYGPASDVDDFCEKLAANLLPNAIQVFARHRWLNSTEAIRDTTLIFSVCNLGDFTSACYP